MASIRTYSAAGVPLRKYSLSSIKYLLRQQRITVERGRDGRIKAAHFRATDDRQEPIGRNPILKRPHRGTYYSRIKQVGDTRLWQHKKLPTARDLEYLFGTVESRRDQDLILRAAFQSVERSVMHRHSRAPVAIHAFKKRFRKPVAVVPLLRQRVTA